MHPVTRSAGWLIRSHLYPALGRLPRNQKIIIGNIFAIFIIAFLLLINLFSLSPMLLRPISSQSLLSKFNENSRFFCGKKRRRRRRRNSAPVFLLRIQNNLFSVWKKTTFKPARRKKNNIGSFETHVALLSSAEPLVRMTV